MLKLPDEHWTFRPGTSEELREVIEMPAEEDLWPSDRHCGSTMSFLSCYFFVGERRGELQGGFATVPLSTVSDSAFVWVKAKDTTIASPVLIKYAQSYIDNMLAHRFRHLYATAACRRAAKFAKWLGFEKDEPFRMRYGIVEYDVYRKSRNDG